MLSLLLMLYCPTSMWRQIFLSQDQLLLVLEWYFLPQVAQAAFHLWGLPEVDLLASSCSTQCQHYFTLEIQLPVGALGLNAFSNPWNFQVSYGVSSYSSGPSCSAQVSRQNMSMVNSDIYFWWLHVGWMLLGFPQFASMLGRFSSAVSLS